MTLNKQCIYDGPSIRGGGGGGHGTLGHSGSLHVMWCVLQGREAARADRKKKKKMRDAQEAVTRRCQSHKLNRTKRVILLKFVMTSFVFHQSTLLFANSIE